MERVNLLLVEDNPGDAFLIEEMLSGTENPSHHVETCSELSGALARISAEGIDAILLDLSLPDSHGLETLRRTLSHTAVVPIVVLTGLDDQALGVLAVQEGAQDYLVKGEVSARLLTRALRYAIERQRIELERKALVADLEAFAHTVAHDLKGPLTPLILAGDILQVQAHQLPQEKIEACGKLIVRNAKIMSSIIDELLLLASVRRQEIKAETVDMAMVFENALRRLDYLIEMHQAQITAPSAWPDALGYGPWLVEVWTNYLSNAITYGGQPALIEVGATERQNGTVCFWVRDYGPGIPTASQERLFTPFTRLSQAQATGHGLGLSIVQRIVDKLGGRVGVESEPDQGSTFTFTLPAV